MQIIIYSKIQLCSWISLAISLAPTSWIITFPTFHQSEMVGLQHMLLLSLQVLGYDWVLMNS